MGHITGIFILFGGRTEIACFFILFHCCYCFVCLQGSSVGSCCEYGLWNQTAWVQNPAVPLTCSVTLGQSLSFSEPQFHPLSNSNNNIPHRIALRMKWDTYIKITQSHIWYSGSSGSWLSKLRLANEVLRRKEVDKSSLAHVLSSIVLKILC